MAAAAAAAGLGVPVVVGARFALEPGRGRSAVPVRPALLGAVVGVLGVLAAFTFSAGVSDAVANPARFGQTWQLGAFLGVGGQDFGPARQVLRAVAADPDVTGVDDARVASAQSGQVSVESFTYDPVAGKPVPVVLTGGRMPAAPDEIVLAPTTATELHAATGSVVRLTGGTVPRAMTVTGIGFVPTGLHNYYDTGAWLTPAGYDRIFRGAHSGFKFHLAAVALRPGADTQALARRLTARAAAVKGGQQFVFTPQPPVSQVQMVKDVAVLPLALSAFLAVLADRSRRARPVHRGPPSSPRTGRSARAGPDPAAVPAGDRHPGHPARRRRAGLRHPAGHRARPDPVARCRRPGAAGLPAAGGAAGRCC